MHQIKCRLSAVSIAAFCVLLSSLHAAPTEQEARWHQALLDLTNDYVVMCVAAHPDDEDGQTLTYLRKKLGVETIVVVSSRGEGGQNEIGPELYKDLGVIRTHEMDAAGKINGAKYFNLNNIDFGFSKSGEEAKEFWGWDEGLINMVRLIREHRPQVIITHHDKISGHGQHQLTGQWVEAAFDLAADANYIIPRTASGKGQISPWQVSRFFVRTRNPQSARGVVISTPVGKTDKFWQESYASIARRGLAEHKSQGMDKLRRDGFPANLATHYELIKSAPGVPEPKTSLLDGIENKSPYAGKLLDKMQNPELQTLLDYETFRYTKPHGTLMRNRFYRARATIFNANVELKTSRDWVTRGEVVTVTTTVDANVPDLKYMGARLLKSSIPGWTTNDNKGREMNGPGDITFHITAPEHEQYSVPHTAYYYNFLSNLPKPVVYINAVFHPGPSEMRGDENWGMVHVPAITTLDYVPLTELRLSTDLVMTTPDGSPIPLTATLINNGPKPLDRQVYTLSPDGWSIVDNPLQTFTIPARDTLTVDFSVQQPHNVAAGDYDFSVGFVGDKHKTASTTVTVRKIDVEVAPNLLVGLVRSYDNILQNSLEQLGVAYELLDKADLANGDLGKFDTIILDIRAYLVRKDLIQHNDRIKQYVHNGGHVICMYNKTFEWNSPEGSDNYAPVPLRISRDRVTREDAAITILEPQHPLFNFPNKIDARDWDGWVQERGLYFPASVPDGYTPLLSTHDPAEAPLLSGHLIAQYGKGTYLYTSYVWYRQLKILVRGGVRNFANTISFPRAAGISMP